MSSLTTAADIWVLTPEHEDFVAGAHYAAISMPWTFDRMALNTGINGQNRRALNIAKGILGQEMLKRALAKIGVAVQSQRKSHRSEDLFDLHVGLGGHTFRLDFKTTNYYTDYQPLGRDPLDRDLIIKNADYFGAEWFHFFPMLVPHTQIRTNIELYCFAIASSIDYRNQLFTGRSGERFAAFPYGEAYRFLCSRKLCDARERDGKGFFLSLRWHKAGLIEPDRLRVVVNGEWAGQLIQREASLTGSHDETVGPFSLVSSLELRADDFHEWMNGTISLHVVQNQFRGDVRDSQKVNINVHPREAIVFAKSGFCNLMLPRDYSLYVVGWCTKPDFLADCRQYSGWIWPNDKVNKWENIAWTQITGDDAKNLVGAGFRDCVGPTGTQLKAGWLKTHGRGGGACCYMYPNVSKGGGVKETNLYVLPRNLKTMGSLS